MNLLDLVKKRFKRGGTVTDIKALLDRNNGVMYIGGVEGNIDTSRLPRDRELRPGENAAVDAEAAFIARQRAEFKSRRKENG